MNPELVILGNLIVDDIVYEDGTTSIGQPGGAALYAALGARLWGIEVGIGSVVGEDYPAAILGALEGRGIDLAGVRRVLGPGMRTWLLYEGRRRQVVHRLDTPTHSQMSPRPGELPVSWRTAAMHLAPMPLAVQEEWLDAPLRARSPLVSLDPFELVDQASIDRCRSAFHRADAVLLSEDEVLIPGAFDQPAEVLRTLAGEPGTASRLRLLVLKRGALGGVAYDPVARSVAEWAARSSDIVDPTGAGDALAGGLLAGLAQGRPLEEALRQGVVSASFALEGRGASALLEARESQSRSRLLEWFGSGVPR